MQKTYILITFLIVGIATFMASDGYTDITGPGNGLTGAPREGTCVQCHSGTINSGSADYNITMDTVGLTEYIPGQTYTMHVGFANNTRTRNGFELTAVGSTTGRNGTIAVVNATATKIGSAGGRQYIKHTQNGVNGFQSWDFHWTAPVAGSGSVTFYSCGNASNANNSDRGDEIYSTSMTLTERVATAAKPLAIVAGSLSAFPNPAAGSTQVAFRMSSTEQALLALYDLQGREVATQHLGEVASGNQSVRFEIPAGVSAGAYVLRLEAGNKASATRLNIL